MDEGAQDAELLEVLRQRRQRAQRATKKDEFDEDGEAEKDMENEEDVLEKDFGGRVVAFNTREDREEGEGDFDKDGFYVFNKRRRLQTDKLGRLAKRARTRQGTIGTGEDSDEDEEDAWMQDLEKTSNELKKEKAQKGDDDKANEQQGAKGRGGAVKSPPPPIHVTLSNLIRLLKPGETVQRGLKRLEKVTPKQMRKASGTAAQRIAAGNSKNDEEAEEGKVPTQAGTEDQAQPKTDLDKLKELAYLLMDAGADTIYTMPYEALLDRQEAAEARWNAHRAAAAADLAAERAAAERATAQPPPDSTKWELRWATEAEAADGKVPKSGEAGEKGNVHGPLTSAEMAAWQGQGYFTQKLAFVRKVQTDMFEDVDPWKPAHTVDFGPVAAGGSE